MSMQAYFDTIAAKTGKTPEELVALAKAEHAVAVFVAASTHDGARQGINEVEVAAAAAAAASLKRWPYRLDVSAVTPAA